MKRIETVPVKHPPEPLWQKTGQHLQIRVLISDRMNFKLKQGFAGDLHFSQQQQPLLRLYLQYPPEIQCISNPQFGWVTASTTQSNTTE